VPRPLAHSDATARQTAQESDRLRHMYARLDDATQRVRDDLARTLREPVSDPAALHARDARAAMLDRRRRTLDAAEDALCFGRLDSADGEVRYVGRLGLQGDDDTPLLIDWRADAARPFYAATPVHPMGLRRRRHLRVEGRAVSAVTDELLDGSTPGPDDVVGDGPLLEALAARRTDRMRDAVATLQSEQDAIVRSDHRGVLVVEGGPGTGKTVVALHRAAYVLAAFDGAADDGVLVLGPSTRFLDYISQVLPSLGENDVVLATAASMVGDGVTPDGLRPADPRLARVLGRAALADALAAVVRSRQAPDGTLEVVVGGEPVLLDAAAVAEARERAGADTQPHNAARAAFLAEIVEMVVDAAQQQSRDALARVDEEVAAMGTLTARDLDVVAAADLRRLGFEGEAATDAADELDPNALRAELSDDTAVDRAVESLWPRLTPERVVDALLADTEALATHLPGFDDDERAVLHRSAGDAWTGAHLPLLDEARHLVNGPPERTYGHVVVDEAQELSPMQWRAVLRRCPRRSLTVVGDLAQAGPASDATSWAGVLPADLLRRADVRTLTVCYRTTAEILEASAGLLARVAPEQRVSRAVRHGEAPRRVTVDDGELVAAVAREARTLADTSPGGIVGVVAADHAVPVLAAALGSAGDDDPVRVVPVSQVRGLEFDGAVVVDPVAIENARPGGERDLYVALTRATTRLSVVEPVGG
jgi:DNA helicase IV